MTATNQSFTQAHFAVPVESEPAPRREHTRRPVQSSTPESTDIDLTIDEAGAPWLPNAGHESDGESPLRLTLARATPGEDGDGIWQPLVDRVRLASGKRVPGTRYRIIRWLGEGGMGMVFEALHVDIQRPVALKILKPGVAGALTQHDRFLDEARAVAQVDSRFVVDVLDFGELPDGRPFYTMELLDPVSLYDELRAGPLALERALPILRQCCKALAAVHTQGLAHRDVKPQNVLIQTEDGRTDAVRIVDFGIAAKFDSQPRIAGTAMYMAPEQIIGSDFDGRLDIYGLGCVAYELLTGAPPFEGASAAEMVRRHLDAPVVAPSTRVASLPPALDAVLVKCLAKRPQDRYANMHELEAALCEVQIAQDFTTPWDDLPLPAIDDDRRADLRRRMPQPRVDQQRRSPWLGLGLGLGLGALVLGLITATAVLTVQTRPVTHSTEYSAAMSGIQATTEAARVAGSRAYWAYPPASQPDYPTALRMINTLEDEPGALRYIARARAKELREEFAETLVRLGDQYWSAPNGRPFAIEYYAQALLFDDGQPRARERTSLTPAQLADVVARASEGEFSPVEVEVAEVLRALAEPNTELRRERVAALLADDQHVMASVRFRSELASLVGVEASADAAATPDAEQAPDDAEPVRSRAKSGSASPSSTPAHPVDDATQDRAQAHLDRATAALARGNRDRAERLFLKALAINPRLKNAHVGLAEIHFAHGRYQEAMSAARQAVRTDADDASLQLLLGDSYLKTLRYDDARRAYERARVLGHSKAKQRLQQLDEVTQ